MGLNAEQETEAIETTLRWLRAEARKAEARKAEFDADELARLQELRDAVRAWTQDHTSHADQLLATAFDRAEREAEYALTVRRIARMHVERMSPNVATCDEKEK